MKPPLRKREHTQQYEKELDALARVSQLLAIQSGQRQMLCLDRCAGCVAVGPWLLGTLRTDCAASGGRPHLPGRYRGRFEPVPDASFLTSIGLCWLGITQRRTQGISATTLTAGLIVSGLRIYVLPRSHCRDIGRVETAITSHRNPLARPLNTMWTSGNSSSYSNGRWSIQPWCNLTKESSKGNWMLSFNGRPTLLYAIPSPR